MGMADVGWCGMMCWVWTWWDLAVCSMTWYSTAVGLGTSMLELVKVGVWSGVRAWHETSV